jgi:hypothetical protein
MMLNRHHVTISADPRMPAERRECRHFDPICRVSATSAPMNIPPTFARNVVENWPGDGELWLAALPDLIAEIAEDWQLVLGPSFSLSLHWVTAATRADGLSAVLKLGVPAEHRACEVQALQLYDGRGAVRLLAEDLPRGAGRAWNPGGLARPRP